MNLRHVSQEDLVGGAQKICPLLEDQSEGADAYQITFVISTMLQQYDRSRTNPHFCTDTQCIIDSLVRRRPVIMLRAGHAVLVVGIDYLPEKTGLHVEALFVLDPASSGPQVAEWTPISFCNADVFLAY